MTNLRPKLGQYQANGAQLGWLLLPDQRAVEIWRGGQEGMPERQEIATLLEGGEGFAGSALELREIRAV